MWLCHTACSLCYIDFAKQDANASFMSSYSLYVVQGGLASGHWKLIGETATWPFRGKGVFPDQKGLIANANHFLSM